MFFPYGDDPIPQAKFFFEDDLIFIFCVGYPLMSLLDV